MFKLIFILPIITFLLGQIEILKKKYVTLVLSLSLFIILSWQLLTLDQNLINDINLNYSLEGVLNFQYLFGFDLLSYFLGAIASLSIVFSTLKKQPEQNFNSLALIGSFVVAQFVFTSQNLMSYIFTSEVFIFIVALMVSMKGKKSLKISSCLGFSHIIIITSFIVIVFLGGGFNVSYEAIQIKYGLLDQKSIYLKLACLSLFFGMLIRTEVLPTISFKDELEDILGSDLGSKIFSFINLVTFVGFVRFVLPYLDKDFMKYKDIIISLGLLSVLLKVNKYRLLKIQDKISNYTSIFSILAFVSLFTLSKHGVLTSGLMFFTVAILSAQNKKLSNLNILIISALLIGLPGLSGFLNMIYLVKTFVFYNVLTMSLISLLLIYIVFDSVKVLSGAKMKEVKVEFLESSKIERVKIVITAVLVFSFGCYGIQIIEKLLPLIENFLNKMA